MKMTKTLYLRKYDHLTNETEIFDSVILFETQEPDLVPDHWVKLKDIEIDIPDSLINDIISANTKDVDDKISEHKAAIVKLEESRSKEK